MPCIYISSFSFLKHIVETLTNNQHTAIIMQVHLRNTQLPAMFLAQTLHNYGTCVSTDEITFS